MGAGACCCSEGSSQQVDDHVHVDLEVPWVEEMPGLHGEECEAVNERLGEFADGRAQEMPPACGSAAAGPGHSRASGSHSSGSGLGEDGDRAEPPQQAASSSLTAPKPQRFHMTLSKDCPAERLGMDVKCLEEELEVLFVYPMGPVARAHEKAARDYWVGGVAQEMIRAGDHIVQVNGVAGSPSDMLVECTRSSTLNLVVERPPRLLSMAAEKASEQAAPAPGARDDAAARPLAPTLLQRPTLGVPPLKGRARAPEVPRLILPTQYDPPFSEEPEIRREPSPEAASSGADSCSLVAPGASRKGHRAAHRVLSPVPERS